MDGRITNSEDRFCLVAKMEGLWDAKKEMGIVKAEQAKGLTLERKEGGRGVGEEE
jgi:hypothetical protein